MKLFSALSEGFQKAADGFYALWPRPIPSVERLKNCKIVSHRGEHDRKTVFENTLAAFDRARDLGVWGIEFDVRWTQDLHPVVIHDPDLKRVFGLNLTVKDVELQQLQSVCPAVPLLAEVIDRYGKNLHLMVEIKTERYPDPDRQNQILKACFAGLEPRIDYHLISLTPEMFDLITFVPASTFVPVAEMNLTRLSRIALQQDYGGVAGHYLLLNQKIMAVHRQRGQKVGTGYPASKNCLLREINRGVEWIFSNNAGELQAILNRTIDRMNSRS